MLLVDDEEPIRDVAQRILRRLGHEVDAAADAAGALALLEAMPYDVILCDVRMPGGSGPEFYDELRRRGLAEHTRLVLTTGDETDAEAQRCLEQGRVTLLLKPFELEKLRQAVS